MLIESTEDPGMSGNDPFTITGPDPLRLYGELTVQARKTENPSGSR